ncbi:DUF2590 family protein [Pseudoalteromonas tunicata]|jgi:hypothetical protein|uniref:Probable phage protein n=1 Tax=Pseudoalteromonas tunicata D2 TaxID=87626 RepID=A4C8U1_9GAMM|nr:DUF2590 family protein [Pseudoalteromonas tunicata]ATC93509.1 hypothetical protein PTUN_a0771 [Pseudoalteromonas tunicata]AXT32547.1 DUF2590 family protein [Pseudoalteromonas tunicata]EAR29006.1 probable phage protein [Pseudoalteromonas tunicata D2]
MIHIDLNIIDGDLNFDAMLQPATLSGRDVINQDIKHRILESGLLPQLVGLRNKNYISKILTEIELVVEQDERLVPGTINVVLKQNGQINVTAKTKQYGVTA